MTAPAGDVPFKIFRQLNDPGLERLAGSPLRLDARMAAAAFASDSLPDKIVRALGARRAIRAKEVFESFELFGRVRRRLRAPHVADLCCGHGLTGLLFAAFERRVERVTLVDHERPMSWGNVLGAVASVAPWVRAKIEYVVAPMHVAARALPRGTSVVGVHACGVRTDRCLDVALALRGHVAVMPCCYAQTTKDAPRAVRGALGAELTADVHRTYRLEAAGYRVAWSAIPRAVTAMNRILVGVSPGPGS